MNHTWLRLRLEVMRRELQTMMEQYDADKGSENFKDRELPAVLVAIDSAISEIRKYEE